MLEMEKLKKRGPTAIQPKLLVYLNIMANIKYTKTIPEIHH